MTISISFSDKIVRVAVEIDGKIESLITELPQRQWVGLTWEEIYECFKITPDQYLPANIYKRIEAKLKEKNT